MDKQVTTRQTLLAKMPNLWMNFVKAKEFHLLIQDYLKTQMVHLS